MKLQQTPSPGRRVGPLLRLKHDGRMWDETPFHPFRPFRPFHLLCLVCHQRPLMGLHVPVDVLEDTLPGSIFWLIISRSGNPLDLVPSLLAPCHRAV